MEEDNKKAAKILMNQTIGKYMDDFRLARIFKYWLYLYCYNKTLENNLIRSWIIKSHRVVIKAFLSWKSYQQHIAMKKLRHNEIHQKLSCLMDFHIAQKYFRSWFEVIKNRLKLKKNIFIEWKKFSSFKKREKKIQSLKKSVIQKNLENLAIRMLFDAWKNSFFIKFELKKKVFLGFKTWTNLQKKLKIFQNRRIQSKQPIENKKILIFVSWQNYTQMMKKIQNFYSKNQLSKYFQHLIEHTKKAFTKNLFTKKIQNHSNNTLKKRYLNYIKVFKIHSLLTKSKKNRSITHNTQHLLNKYFAILQSYSNIAHNKRILIINSLNFNKTKKQSFLFESLKNYISQRTKKKLRLNQAKDLRIFDMQQSALLSWINRSFQVKQQTEQEKFAKEEQKMNKVWKIVQRFVDILKFKTRKRLNSRHVPILPKTQFVNDSVIEITHQSRKRPEPRRLNILSTIN